MKGIEIIKGKIVVDIKRENDSLTIFFSDGSDLTVYPTWEPYDQTGLEVIFSQDGKELEV